MDLRNFTFLVYGYSAAMLVSFGYVTLLVLRSRRIDRELTRLKSLVEDKN